MTKTTISFEAEPFLTSMRSRSFTFIGAAMLVRAHLTLAPNNRISRADMHKIFNTRTPLTRATIDDVLDLCFQVDDQQMVFHPAIDRATAEARAS